MVAAVWLVGSFFCVAVCYVLMSATFLAALQVLVYAGAMMVLFVFVVMVLDVDERGTAREPRTRRSRGVVYYVFGGSLVLGLSWILWGTVTRQFRTPGRPIGPDFGIPWRVRNSKDAWTPMAAPSSGDLSCAASSISAGS